MAYITSELCDLLNDEHIQALNNSNIWTVNDLCSANLMDVRKETNIKYNILKEVHDKIRQRYTMPCNEFNFLLEKSILECKMCPTGLPELTLALDGGFQTQEIVEFYGDSECGKTEMCYLLSGEILSHFDDYHILFITSTYDIDHEKLAKYTRSKAGNREMSDEDIFKCLSRVEVARPMKLADLVHLLNTLVHSDKRNSTKCIIIDSLSFIIQEDILEIKTSNLNDGDELEKFVGLRGHSFINQESCSSIENARRELIDIYLNEVMRLLINVAITKNVIIVITNSDTQLTFSKSWTNAIDHRIHLDRMSEFSRYYLQNQGSTVCSATILKTIHNISRIGHSIPFAINDEGLFAIRLASVTSSAEDVEDDDEDNDR